MLDEYHRATIFSKHHFTEGFLAYQWQKDEVTISTATSNNYTDAPPVCSVRFMLPSIAGKNLFFIRILTYYMKSVQPDRPPGMTFLS